jgi:hypothetical protein
VEDFCRVDAYNEQYPFPNLRLGTALKRIVNSNSQTYDWNIGFKDITKDYIQLHSLLAHYEAQWKHLTMLHRFIDKTRLNPKNSLSVDMTRVLVSVNDRDIERERQSILAYLPRLEQALATVFGYYAEMRRKFPKNWQIERYTTHIPPYPGYG